MKSVLFLAIISLLSTTPFITATLSLSPSSTDFDDLNASLLRRSIRNAAAASAHSQRLRHPRPKPGGSLVRKCSSREPVPEGCKRRTIVNSNLPTSIPTTSTISLAEPTSTSISTDTTVDLTTTSVMSDIPAVETAGGEVVDLAAAANKGTTRLVQPTTTSRLVSPTTTTTSSSTTPTKSNTNTGIFGLSTQGLVKNSIAIGFLPDDGSGGGQSETMAALNSATGGKASTYGYYAQCVPGVPFTGQQLLYRMNDIVASGAVFQPAIMPTHGWAGLTYADNSQAVRIAQVMKKFVDAGVTEIWLRFAHEVNWYQYDGTYTGGIAEFKEGWAVVAAAIKQYAPTVKMFFTPNVAASPTTYDLFYPDDRSTVDLIGIDYYPKDLNNLDFISVMKPFHDKYTSATTKFAIGETGLGVTSTVAQRNQWLEMITSAKTKQAMPNFISVSWFNYMKGYDFRIVGIDNTEIISYLSS